MLGSARREWSWTALGLWLANGVLAASLVTGLLIGPQLANRAWDVGVHVTPAQAAMHYALIASGFSHHHGRPASQVHSALAPNDEKPALQSAGPGLTWGTPLTQTVQLPSACCLVTNSRTVSTPEWLEPSSADLPPPSPPP
ncbi:MAG TPA: hypothetical protein VKU60_18455, partial [Chloroflexota bacterium]|nr:hypothetical protein [Chloroflexota bacterium]